MRRRNRALDAIMPADLDGRTKEARALKKRAKERQDIIDGVISGLGRVPTTDDQLAIGDLASLNLLARDLERAGQYEKAAKIRDQAARLRRATGLKPAAPVQKPERRLSPAERFAALPEAKGTV